MSNGKCYRSETLFPVHCSCDKRELSRKAQRQQLPRDCALHEGKCLAGNFQLTEFTIPCRFLLRDGESDVVFEEAHLLSILRQRRRFSAKNRLEFLSPLPESQGKIKR